MASFALAGWCPRAAAQVVDSTAWVPNGTVNALLRDGNTLYLGGAFTRVGPVTGGFAPVDEGTGQLGTTCPKVAGWLTTLRSDGDGGWYLAGGFTAVGAQPRTHLAHVLADGTVTAWAPVLDGPVSCFALHENRLYVGGQFTSIDGQPRAHLAAFDLATGTLTSWNPGITGTATPDVRALVASSTTVYAAGSFTTVGAVTRSSIAAIDAVTGLATVWNPAANGVVMGLVPASGTTLVACGSFTSIGGQTRNRIAMLDLSSGAATSWNPGADNIVQCVATSGSTVYAGGNFANIGGQARSRVAALDATTGLATAWNPGANNRVMAIRPDGGVVRVGGAFTTIGGQPRQFAAALDAATGAATSWAPDPSNVVYALEPGSGDGQVWLGGGFTTVGGRARSRLAALDLATGQLAAWNPGADSTVYALAKNGATIVAGGDFVTAGGQPRARLAAFDAASGNVTAWSPGADTTVLALAVGNGRLYAGGRFGNAGGQARSRLAAFDLGTGALTAWNPGVDARVRCLAVSGNRVYVGGDFHAISGFTYSFYLAALNATTGAAITTWTPDPLGSVYTVLPMGGSVTYGGTFTDIGTTGRHYLVRVDTLTAALDPGWYPAANAPVYALAANANAVVAGGAFTSIGGASRSMLAALDTVDATANAWTVSPNGGVYALSASSDLVCAGGAFTWVSGLPQSYLALVRTPPIESANLQWPPTLDAAVGLPSASVYGRVWISGLTDRAGATPGLVAELGWGPPGVAPGTPGAWQWASASYHVDQQGGDEFVASLTVPVAGAFDYGWRYSYAGGAWVYADLDGSANGWSSAQAGKLTVGLPAVGWCNLQWPPTLATIVNAATEMAYGQVWMAGVTDRAGAGAGIRAQLGYGPDGSDPATSAAWTWVDATYNVDHGNNDEWMARLTPPTPGSYDYGFRFRCNSGPWTYGDLDGSGNGWQSAQAGALTVSPATGVESAAPTELSFSCIGRNPAPGAATFRLGLPATAHVRASVYDVSGRRVAELTDGERAAGWHTLTWEPARDHVDASGGMYFVRAIVGGREFTRRVVTLR